MAGKPTFEFLDPPRSDQTGAKGQDAARGAGTEARPHHCRTPAPVRTRTDTSPARELTFERLQQPDHRLGWQSEHALMLRPGAGKLAGSLRSRVEEARGPQ